MKHITKIIVVAYFLLFYASTLIGAPRSLTHSHNRVLVINAYNEFNPWSKTFIKALETDDSRKQPADIHVAHINMLMIDDKEMLEKQWTRIAEAYMQDKPDMVVLIGASSFILCDRINQKWPDISMLLCGELDYTGPEDLVLQKKALAPHEHIPLAQLRKSYNLTYLKTSIFLEENVDMLERIIPDMHTLLYIGDETYISQQNDSDLSCLVRQKYPQLDYHFLSSKELSVDSLFTMLNNVDANTTGILFGTWMPKQTFSGNTLLMSNSHRIIGTAPVPLFSIRNTGIENDGSIVGGYIYDEKTFLLLLNNYINMILDGKDARSMEPFLVKSGNPVFNYEALQQYNIPLWRCPEDSIFYNTPPGFWSEYGYSIVIGALIFSILLILFFVSRLRIQELKKREMENALKNHDLVNNMPILYMFEELILDEDGHITDTIYVEVNKFFNDCFLPNEACLGKKASELFPESLEVFLPNMETALKENRTVAFPYYYEAIGTCYNVVVRPSFNGKYMHVYCIDNTELHQIQTKMEEANKKLNMILEVADMTPWRWNLKEGVIKYTINKNVNTRYLETHMEEGVFCISESDRWNMIHKDDLEYVLENYRMLVEGKVEKINIIYRTRSDEGGQEKTEWVEVQGRVDTLGKDGVPVSLIGSTHNITKNKELELELIKAKETAERSNRLKSIFLANMSHEIRTPLNAIVGFSQILATAEDENEKQEYLRIILDNNNLLLQLIGDILDLSKIEAGSMEYVYSDFDLNQLMDDLYEAFKLKIPADKPVVLSYEIGMDTCHIHFEKNRLFQLITNLLNNAVKFTEQGSIKYGYKKKDDDTLYFYVTDTGRGIPADKQSSIFERFTKLNSFIQGTGLGLPICKMLLENLGGQLGVDSEEGKGSTFWFTIPFKPVMVHTQAKETNLEVKQMEQKKIDILVAEDHESNYKLIEAILHKDYNLIHAWNGQEAVELFKAHAPQLILMDINMPVKNGYEATKEIREISTQVPIIAVTAYAYASDEQKVLDSGFNAYISKPITAGGLRKNIQTILGQYFSFD